jgi:hypothetical protein
MNFGHRQGALMAETRTTWFLSALAVCAGSVDARADEYRDAKHHFSVTLPKGWMAGNERMVKIVNRDQMEHSPVKTPCVGYFFRAERPDTVYPHVLVSWQEGGFGDASYEQIEAELGLSASDPVFQEQLRQKRESISQLVPKSSTGKAFLDRSRNCLVIHTKLHSVEKGDLQRLTVGFLGAKGILRFQYWQTDEGFDKSLPEFTSMLDTFRWVPGYDFHPSESQKPTKQANSGLRGNRALLITVSISAAVVLSLLIVLTYIRKSSAG